MFRSHHQAPADDTALTPPSWGLNNSGGTGVNRGASQSNRAGSLPSSPISAIARRAPDMGALKRHSDQATLRVGMRLASVQAKAQRCLGGVTSEPCDREVSRSVRRLALLRPNSSVGQSSGPVPRRSAVQLGLGASLGSCGGSSRASRLPGSARPTVDGTRPANDDDVSLASVCGSALVVVGAFLLALVVYCW